MADLNDPSGPAKAEEPAVAEKAAAAEPTDTAAETEPAVTAPAARDDKPAAEKPAAVATPAPEPATEKPAEKPTGAAIKAEPAAEAKPAEDKPAAEATPVTETEPAPVETKPAAETEPAPVETKPAAEATPAADTETGPGTVLPDSIVAGTAATAASDESDADDSEGGSKDDAAAPPVRAAKPSRKPRKPRKSISRPRPLVAALSLLLVLLLVAGVTLFVHNHKVSTAEASKSAALDTARQVATSLTTITPDNAAGQIDDLAKHSTGSFKDQIGGYSAMFQAVLKQGNVASRGTITAAGIEKMEGDAASALVAVSALITSGQVPQGQPRTYRLLVSLQRNGDQWLASNVDFVQ